MLGRVDRVWMTSPHAQVIVVSTYSGWMAAFTDSPPHDDRNQDDVSVPHAAAHRQLDGRSDAPRAGRPCRRRRPAHRGRAPPGALGSRPPPAGGAPPAGPGRPTGPPPPDPPARPGRGP